MDKMTVFKRIIREFHERNLLLTEDVEKEEEDGISYVPLWKWLIRG